MPSRVLAVDIGFGRPLDRHWLCDELLESYFSRETNKSVSECSFLCRDIVQEMDIGSCLMSALS
jgi:hypothetical protein